MKSLFSPRAPWLLLYVLANIVATWIMLDTGLLLGDVAGNPVHSKTALLWAAILVVSSYLILLGPVFSLVSRIHVAPIRFQASEQDLAGKIGKLLLVLQAVFMGFNLVTGVNVAGSGTTVSDSPLAMVWVLLPVDMLFVIYYGMYRESKYFYVNAAVWALSNTLRGWSGIYFFILFFEWCRAVRAGKATIGRVLLTVVGVILAYPVIVNIKWLFRASSSADFDLAATFLALVDAMAVEDYMTLIGDGIQHMVGRLQVTSIVSEVMRLSELLQSEYAKGMFAPFWLDGVHGIAWDRATGSPKTPSVGVAFTQYETFSWEAAVGDWNTNIGYVGWFFISPMLAPVYVLYTLALCFLSFYLVRKIGISDAARDMLWLFWLVYILPPWFAAMVTVLQALLIFLLVKLLFARTSRRAGSPALLRSAHDPTFP